MPLSFARAVAAPGTAGPGRTRRGSGAHGSIAPGLVPSVCQALVVSAIFSITGGIAWVGAGSIARVLFVALGLGAAVWYRRKSPWLYLTLTFWFWTLTPFIRRVIDYRAGFDTMNIVLVTPDVMTLLMVPDLLRSHTLLRRRETLIAMMLFVPAVYGLMVSLVQGEVIAGAVAAADWFAPLLYLLFLIDKAEEVDQAESHLLGFVTLNSLITVGYGLYQFWSPPAWDVAWALSSGMLGSNQIENAEIHVFGTLNGQGTQAEWLAALILLSLHFRTWLTPFLMPALSVLLLLTYSRSVTAGVFLGFLIVAVLGQRRMLKGIMVSMIIMTLCVAIAATVDSAVADSVFGRLSSITSLQTDTSALQRTAIWQKSPAVIDAYPMGMGIGALGRGAVASGNSDLVSIDSGPITIYMSLGWIAGTIYLFGIAWALGQALVTAIRLRTPIVVACTTAAICSAAEIPFVIIYGFAGTVLWLCCGLVLACGIHARLDPDCLDQRAARRSAL